MKGVNINIIGETAHKNLIEISLIRKPGKGGNPPKESRMVINKILFVKFMGFDRVLEIDKILNLLKIEIIEIVRKQ